MRRLGGSGRLREGAATADWALVPHEAGVNPPLGPRAWGSAETVPRMQVRLRSFFW